MRRNCLSTVSDDKDYLIWFSIGLVTSRRIANVCATNISLMSFSGDIQPHYTSIAAFVSRKSEQIEPLFTQVLMICDKGGGSPRDP
jgi:Transposase domain (DUF772)